MAEPTKSEFRQFLEEPSTAPPPQAQSEFMEFLQGPQAGPQALPNELPEQFMGVGLPNRQQFDDMQADSEARDAGFNFTLRKEGEKIIKRKMADPENVGWTPGDRSPESFAANKLGRSEGAYLGFGDEVLGLVNKDAGKFKADLKDAAKRLYPEDFNSGQAEGNIFNAMVTSPVAAPKALNIARLMPRGTQGVTAGASSAVAWDTLDQMGTGRGTAQERFENIDTDRTKTAAAVGGGLGGALSVFTRSLNNGQSELGTLLEGLVDDAGAVSDDGVRAFETFFRHNGLAFDDVTRGRINDAVQQGRHSSSVALSLPVRLKDILIDAFEDGSGNFRKAVETQLRGTMVQGGDGAARIAQSVDEDIAASRVALDENYGRVLGKKARIKSEDQTKDQLAQIGREGYEPVLSKQLSESEKAGLNNVLNGPGMDKLKSPLQEIAAGEGLLLDEMITNSPLRAAHWMQSKARQLAESGTDVVKANAFGGLRRRLLEVINEVAPEYDKVRRKYGDEFGNLQALEFGDKFLTQARDAFQIDRMQRAFSDLSPKQRNVALLSVRDALRSASGRGRRNSAPRLTRVGDEQVLDALEQVFGKRGARVAQGIEEISEFVQSRQAIDSRRGSPTASNQEAVKAATENVQSPLRRKVGGFMQNIAGDAAYTAAGFAPINSMRKAIGRAGQQVSGDMSNRMNELALLLEAPVKSTAPVKPKRAPQPKGPDGKFISKAKAAELGIIDAISAKAEPVQNGLPMSGTVGGAAIGGINPDFNQDGEVTWAERMAGIAGGAALGRYGGRMAGKVDDAITSQGSRQVLQGRANANGVGPKGDLPMDEASRMARAREMGFDTDTTVYHGTARDFDGFDPAAPSQTKSGMEGSPGQAVFLTDSPKTAEAYARRSGFRHGDEPAGARSAAYKKTFRAENAIFPWTKKKREAEALEAWTRLTSNRELDGGAQIIPAHVRLNNPMVVDDMSRFSQERMNEVIAEAKAAGHDGVQIRGLYDEWGDEAQSYTIVFDPKNIRSKYAKFDPAQADSPVLTNGFGGQPIRRKDAMKAVREQGGFQRTDPPKDAPIVRQRREAALPRHSNERGHSPLLPLLGIGAGGAGIAYLNQPKAATVAPDEQRQERETLNPSVAKQQLVAQLADSLSLSTGSQARKTGQELMQKRIQLLDELIARESAAAGRPRGSAELEAARQRITDRLVRSIQTSSLATSEGVRNDLLRSLDEIDALIAANPAAPEAPSIKPALQQR